MVAVVCGDAELDIWLEALRFAVEALAEVPNVAGLPDATPFKRALSGIRITPGTNCLPTDTPTSTHLHIRTDRMLLT